MFIHLSRHPSGKGFIVKDGDRVVIESDTIDDARRKGMSEAMRTGRMLISLLTDVKVRSAKSKNPAVGAAGF